MTIVLYPKRGLFVKGFLQKFKFSWGVRFPDRQKSPFRRRKPHKRRARTPKRYVRGVLLTFRGNPSRRRSSPPEGGKSRAGDVPPNQSAVSLTSVVLEALAAEHGLVVARLEGNLAGLAALSTHSVEHRTTVALTAVCLPCSPAVPASLRLVLEALLGVKLLLARRKNEFPSAILADQSLVSVHVIPQFFLCSCCCRHPARLRSLYSLSADLSRVI